MRKRRSAWAPGSVYRFDKTDPSFETLVGTRITIDPSGCWLWTGRLDEFGYGVFSDKGRTVRVYRFVFETFNGPIPRGWHLHHRCEVKDCCNPEHLQALTPSEHSRLHAAARRSG